MARIAQLYKIKFDRAALMAIASTTAATQVGRAAFTGLLKMVPGAGTIVGGAIGAGVATTFTYAMGQAWLAVCQRVAAGRLTALNGAIDNDAVREVFLEEFKNRLRAAAQGEHAVGFVRRPAGGPLQSRAVWSVRRS